MINILVVEDNDLLRENICEILELEGYKTHPAENGKVALKKAYSINPDLILSDVNMPEMDGLELLKQVKEDTVLKQIPFIFLTVRNTMQELRMGMNYGADDYLAKPFDMDQLLVSVGSRLKRHEISSKDEIDAAIKEDKHQMALKQYVELPLVKLQKTGIDLQQSKGSHLTEPRRLGHFIKHTSEKIQKNLSAILLSMKLDSWESDEQIPEYMKQESSQDIKEVIVPIIDKYTSLVSTEIKTDVENARIAISPTFLEIICNELIENAVRFSHLHQQVIIEGKITSEKDYTLNISNHGIPFPKDQLSRVTPYNTFHQHTDTLSGIGLGLSNSIRLLSLTNHSYQISTPTQEKTLITLTLTRGHQ